MVATSVNSRDHVTFYLNKSKTFQNVIQISPLVLMLWTEIGIMIGVEHLVLLTE